MKEEPVLPEICVVCHQPSDGGRYGRLPVCSACCTDTSPKSLKDWLFMNALDWADDERELSWIAAHPRYWEDPPFHDRGKPVEKGN